MPHLEGHDRPGAGRRQPAEQGRVRSDLSARIGRIEEALARIEADAGSERHRARPSGNPVKPTRGRRPPMPIDDSGTPLTMAAAADLLRVCRRPSSNGRCGATSRGWTISPPPGRRSAPAAKDVLIERGTMRLYHYHPRVGDVYRVPLLLVMATTNRGYIFDMVPGQSLVEYLLDAGFRRVHARLGRAARRREAADALPTTCSTSSRHGRRSGTRRNR